MHLVVYEDILDFDSFTTGAGNAFTGAAASSPPHLPSGFRVNYGGTNDLCYAEWDASFDQVDEVWIRMHVRFPVANWPHSSDSTQRSLHVVYLFTDAFTKKILEIHCGGDDAGVNVWAMETYDTAEVAATKTVNVPQLTLGQWYNWEFVYKKGSPATFEWWQDSVLVASEYTRNNTNQAGSVRIGSVRSFTLPASGESFDFTTEVSDYDIINFSSARRRRSRRRHRAGR